MEDILFDSFVVFSPSINYIFQILKFKNTKSSKGFSKFLCLIIMLTHTLRIFFWFTKKYKFTLLIQSIFIIVIQFYLIYLCIKYKEKEIKYKQIPNDNNYNDSVTINIKKDSSEIKNIINIKLMRKIDNAMGYYKIYFFIVFLLSIFNLSLKDNYLYSNAIAYGSIFLEMICSLVQIVEVYRTKTQKNISKIMVLSWLIGNMLKAYYNIYNKCPIQLIIGAYIQVFLNIVLISELIYYYLIDMLLINNEKISIKQDNPNKVVIEGNSDGIVDISEIIN